jgi:hypothetical protein
MEDAFTVQQAYVKTLSPYPMIVSGNEHAEDFHEYWR